MWTEQRFGCALPDGTPRPMATGRQIASPRFSPSGQWISFREGESGWIVSTDGMLRKQWGAGSWVPGRDEAAVLLTNPGSAPESAELKLFTPAGNGNAAASASRNDL